MNNNNQPSFFDDIITFISSFHFSMIDSALIYFWLSIAVGFLIIEMISAGSLFFFPFCFGACIAALGAYLAYTLLTQLVVFLIASVISLIVLQYFFGGSNRHRLPTNTDALINKIGVVTKAIEPHHGGKIRIKHEEWLAESADQSPIAKGTYVHVIDVRGTKLIVK